jgi:hypothetical protein
MTGVFCRPRRDDPGQAVRKGLSPAQSDYSERRNSIPAVIANLGSDFKYEPGMVVAEGDYVMIHGRYIGWAPKQLVAVDIFRVVDGKLVEHWDVMQEEVPADQTASGNAMFINPQAE